MSEYLQSRPTVMTIYKDRVKNNLEVVHDHVGDKVKVCAVVKANAYGHGMIEMSRMYELWGIDYLAVAIIEEGIALRHAGITVPILVVGALAHEQAHLYYEYDLTATGSSLDKLDILNAASKESFNKNKKKIKVHIKIDTGMGRLGVQWDRVDGLIQKLPEYEYLDFEGIFTHCAQSEDNPEYTHIQHERFDSVVSQMEEAGIDFLIVHMANSGATILYPEMHYDMVRPGKLLYGYWFEMPRAGSLEEEIIVKKLEVCFAWETHVAFFKVLEKGACVSYGSNYCVEGEHERFATLPVGYADGYMRSFQHHNQKVMIDGRLYPVVGNICMDQCIVSLGISGEAYNGDRVLLMGKDKAGNEMRPELIAARANTIASDLVTNISERVPRRYV